MFKKVLIIVIIIGAVAFWYFGYGPGKSTGGTADNSNLPPIRVDESSLTKAGQGKLAEVRKLVSRLQRSRKRTWREFEQVETIAGTLAKLGNHRSAAEWFLLKAEWYEELPQEDRKKAVKDDSDPDLILAAAYLAAVDCLFLLGESEKAFEVMEGVLKKYPRSHPAWLWIVGNYNSARKDLRGYIERRGLKADPQYVK
jgi:hypothetical protein